MKISDTTRQRFHKAKWPLLFVVWSVLAFVVYPPAQAVVVFGAFTLCVVFAKRIVWWQMSLKQNKLIKAQPNTHQRGYILQRLSLLPYQDSDQVSDGTQIFMVRDLKQHTVLTVYRMPVKYIGVAYKIEFTQREFVGPASIGNQYRYTTELYVLSPSWAEVRYTKVVSFRQSDASEYAEQEVTEEVLDHLPNEIIERIEYALLHWQAVSLDAQ